MNNLQLQKYGSWIFLGGLLLFCITLPVGVAYNNVSVAMILLGWLLEGRWKSKFEQLKKNKVVLLLTIYYAYLCVSFLYSTNKTYASSTLETQLKLLIFPVVLGSALSLSESKILLVKRTWVVVCLTIGISLLTYAFIRYQKTGNSAFFFYHELSFPLNELSAIYFANYLALAGLFVLLPFGNRVLPSPITRVSAIVFILALTFLLSALSVSLSVIVISFLFLNWRLVPVIGFWKTQFFNLLFVAVILLIFFSLPYTKNKIARTTDLHYEMNYPDSLWNSVTIRLAKWTCGLDVVRQNVLLGTGVGDEMDELMISYEQHGFLEGIRCRYNVHNQYLSTLMAGGLGLLLILATVFICPLKQAFVDNNKLLLGFLILIAITFLTENFLHVHKGVSFVAFFYSLLMLKTEKS